MFGQLARGFLPDAFEDDVAYIGDTDPGNSAKCVSEHQQHGKIHHARPGHVHRVHRPFQRKRQSHLHCGRHQDQDARHGDAPAQFGLIARPKIGHEPLQSAPAIMTLRAGSVRGLGFFGGHYLQIGILDESASGPEARSFRSIVFAVRQKGCGARQNRSRPDGTIAIVPCPAAWRGDGSAPDARTAAHR